MRIGKAMGNASGNVKRKREIDKAVVAAENRKEVAAETGSGLIDDLSLSAALALSIHRPVGKPLNEINLLEELDENASKMTTSNLGKEKMESMMYSTVCD